MNLLHYLFALSFMFMTNMRGGRVLLSLYALELGASPLTIGVLVATFSIMPVLLAWQVGRWADRFGVRWPLLLGALGGAAGISLPFFFHTLPALFIAALANGAAFVAFNVSQQNAVGLISKPEARAQNFSNLTLMISMGNFAGPLLAGFAIDLSGHAAACLYVMAFAAVPAALLIVAGAALPKGAGSSHKGGGHLMELLRDRSLLKVLIVGSLVLASTDLFHFYVPIYTHGLGLSATTIGVILAAYAVASFTVRIFLSRFLERATVEQVLARCFLLAGAAFIFIPFVENAAMLCMLAFLFGFGVSVGQPITMMLTFSNSAEGRSGEVMGLRQTVHNLTQVIAPTVFGSIGSALGLLSVFIVNSVMLLSGALTIRRGSLSRKSATKDLQD